MKKIMLCLFIVLGMLGNGSSVFSMERDLNETNLESEIKNKFNLGTVYFKFFSPRFIVIPGIHSEGKVSLSEDLKTKEQCFNYLQNCKIRNRMSISGYFEKPSSHPKSMIVGSGLFQTMLQPITMFWLKDSFFVDTDKDLYPDICSKFDLKFVDGEEVKNFQGMFDVIYFDDFSDLYSEETLKAASLMLKSRGKLMMTYRDNGNGINLSEEASELYRTLHNEFAHMVQQNTLTKTKLEEHRMSLSNFWKTQICEQLSLYNFDRPMVTTNSIKFQIRENGCQHYHVIGWKK